MYHLELRQFPHVARAFNLSLGDLNARFVAPWVAGAVIDYNDRRWLPERSRMTILKGRELRPEELGMGRGWATATKECTDVTEAVIASGRRGAQARPELDALKAAVEEVAAGTIAFADVVALAAAAQPTWRASEQLGLAEQAVWELLHQGRVEIVSDDGPVPRERWQPIVLSWESWSGEERLRLRLLRP